MNSETSRRSLRKALLAMLAAAAGAALLLLTLVLPAEYGVDPLGTGEAFGLLGLSEQPPAAVTPQAATFAVDVVRFELASFESVEYKYRLPAGASLQFGWEASGATVFDLHAEPDGAAEGFAESFSSGKADADYGTYIAPFPGIHGWFFENRSPLPITLTLTTAGFYRTATEFRDGWEMPRQLPPVSETLVP